MGLSLDKSDLRIAVVGAGVAGLTAAWLLSRRHRVDLFEAQDYFGGHTNTVDIETDGGARLAIDTGFIVYNERNYPLLSALFRHLDVSTEASDMSFAVSIDGGRVEYAGTDAAGLFAQRRNLLRPQFLRMLVDILRFNRLARRWLEQCTDHEASLGEFLDRHGFGTGFRDHYLLPMSAAIWSCPTATMLRFPATSLLRFFANHGLIELVDRPQWRTVVGGGRNYVSKMVAALGGGAQTGKRVRWVRGESDGVSLRYEDHDGYRAEARYDAIVMACHADQAAVLLGPDAAGARAQLEKFPYQRNLAYLHQDPGLMPRLRSVWASWNYLAAGPDPRPEVAVTYWMNRLQSLGTERDYFVSLNPPAPPRGQSVLRQIEYHHPVFTAEAPSAQRAIQGQNGSGGLWFCGSYLGYGFHEDAVRSAVRVAQALGVDVPWSACLPERANRVAPRTLELAGGA